MKNKILQTIFFGIIINLTVCSHVFSQSCTNQNPYVSGLSVLSAPRYFQGSVGGTPITLRGAQASQILLDPTGTSGYLVGQYGGNGLAAPGVQTFPSTGSNYQAYLDGFNSFLIGVDPLTSNLNNWYFTLGNTTTNAAERLISAQTLSSGVVLVGDVFRQSFPPLPADITPSFFGTIPLPQALPITISGPSLFITKRDFSGNVLWTNTIQAAPTGANTLYTLVINDVKKDSQDNTVVLGVVNLAAGPASTDIQFPNGQIFNNILPYTSFVSKFDSNGINTLNFMVNGYYLTGLDISPTDNIYLSGNTFNSSVNISFWTVLDPSGVALSFNTLSNSISNVPEGIAVNPNTLDVYVTGVFFGTQTFGTGSSATVVAAQGAGSFPANSYLAKFSNSGVLQWVHTYANGYVSPVTFVTKDFSDVIIDPNTGDAITRGVFSGVTSGIGSAVGGIDVFLMRTSSSGQVLKVQTLGTTNDEALESFVLSPTGDLHLAGEVADPNFDFICYLKVSCL